MKKKLLLALVTAGALTVFPGSHSLLAADSWKGKEGRIRLDSDALVGAVTLPAGYYRVTWEQDSSGEHRTVFTALDRGNRSKRVTRVKCKLRALDFEAPVTVPVIDISSEYRLKRLWIKGETFQHVFSD